MISHNIAVDAVSCPNEIYIPYRLVNVKTDITNTNINTVKALIIPFFLSLAFSLPERGLLGCSTGANFKIRNIDRPIAGIEINISHSAGIYLDKTAKQQRTTKKIDIHPKCVFA